MTLGCGTYGNNITTDNITPMHLIQIKRLARETREIFPTWYKDVDPGSVSSAVVARPGASVSDLVDSYLSSRKVKSHETKSANPSSTAEKEGKATPGPLSSAPKRNPLDFVCERDVQDAIQAREKIYVHAKSIVTPAARDLAASHDILVQV